MSTQLLPCAGIRAFQSIPREDRTILAAHTAWGDTIPHSLLSSAELNQAKPEAFEQRSDNTEPATSGCDVAEQELPKQLLLSPSETSKPNGMHSQPKSSEGI